MLYPQPFIESLKGRFSVSQIVGKVVKLRRAGREYSGLCPFHKEKTPSFTVNDEKGFYHCFGCGAHGDAIGFIKEYEGISYREAIERLADEAGMALPQPSPQAMAQEKARHSLQDVVEAACRWFESQLMSDAGQPARDYLAERGLSAETVARFRLGFAPNDREAMQRFLLAEGFSQADIARAGLLSQPEDGRAPFAKFRARLMFPIRDRSSKVIAFGGRAIPGIAHPDAPKYLNSPETELFHKGELLYHYDLARRAAFDSGQLIVCEGYMDVIALSQAGLHHAVAPLGTAMSAAQLQLCWQLSNVPVLCMDGDNAGQRAMDRVAELALPLLKPGKSLNFVQLQKGEDPDSLTRSQGLSAFEDKVKQATGLSDHLWQQVSEQIGTIRTPEQRAAQEQQLMELVEHIQDPVVKAHYRSHFRQQCWDQSRSKDKAKSAGQSRGMMRVGRAQLPKQQADKIPKLLAEDTTGGRKQRAAIQCLKLAILYPQLLEDVQAEEFFSRLEGLLTAHLGLHHAMLRWLGQTQSLTHTSLRAAMEQAGHTPALEATLAIHALSLPTGLLNDADNQQLPLAQHVWQQAANAYYHANLLDEYQRAEAEMAAEMNESNWNRFAALKAQLEEIERDRDDLNDRIALEDAF